MTAQNFDKPEVEVKLIYKACKYMTVKADTREEAHRAAYNSFMDMAEKDIFSGSEVEDFFVETSIDGPEGGDMLHG
jgi:hypothetical protein|tara:strand:+ start:710 stop:937 length:228 start_codon:yes stop_codon:yes gene_type:complete